MIVVLLSLTLEFRFYPSRTGMHQTFHSKHSQTSYFEYRAFLVPTI